MKEKMKLWAAFGLLMHIKELVVSQKADHEIVQEIKELIRGMEVDE